MGDDPGVLQVLEEKILQACPNCRFDKATTYIQAVERMVSFTYDLIILDTTGGRGFDLLNLAVMRNFPVAMLASSPLKPDALKRSMGDRAYLPKDKMREVVLFLENMLTYKSLPGWKRVFKIMKGGFGSALGQNSELAIGSAWQEWAK